MAEPTEPVVDNRDVLQKMMQTHQSKVIVSV